MEQTTKLTGTYTKLRNGMWGLRVNGSAKEWDHVAVTKKDGTVREEVVGRVIWTDGQVTIASINKCLQSVKQPKYAADVETKVCWECGCRFTRADARRNGGDWASSYCGC